MITNRLARQSDSMARCSSSARAATQTSKLRKEDDVSQRVRTATTDRETLLWVDVTTDDVIAATVDEVADATVADAIVDDDDAAAPTTTTLLEPTPPNATSALKRSFHTSHAALCDGHLPWSFM